MLHPTHIDIAEDQGRMAKLLAALIVVVGLAGAAAYVVYGSGLWSPHTQHQEP